MTHFGPSADLARAREWAQIAAAFRADELARFYAWAAAQPPPVAKASNAQHPAALDGDRFDRLADCESGGDPTATSPTGKYRGAFQFSLTSWHSAGMDGDPIDYSYADQKAAAMYWASITNPATQWPVCWPQSA